MPRNFFHPGANWRFARRPRVRVNALHLGALPLGVLIAVASMEPAAADDTIVTKAAAIPFTGPAYNWTAFYAGGHLGYAFGS